MAKDLTQLVKESMEVGLAKITARREELTRRRDDFKAQLDAVETELLSLSSQLRIAAKEAFAAAGINLEPPAPSKAARKGGRISKEAREAAENKIVTVVTTLGKEGIAFGQIKEAVANAGMTVADATVSKMLSELVENGKIVRKGDRGSARYFPG
jgi:hypothetical protein